MEKNILTESTKSKFRVLEHKPKNVLKRIQGVLSDFKSNRNGRIYPRELWENVLSSDYVKEMIESHGLVGELDHPETRLEISLQNVSHVINDMWIEGDRVMGIIDILPTPSGKIVSELLDYGTDIGISSRGAGNVGAGNIVDPDYQFVTFDFVARPSCEAARLNMIVESVQNEINTNSDDKVNAILEGYKNNLKEDVFKNYYNKLALPTPGEEELYGYDLSEVCDNVEKYFGLKDKREALNKIVEEHLDKKVIDEVMEYFNSNQYFNSNLKEGHSQEEINMTFVDMCKDALSDELGPDWRKKSLSDIEDIVHSTVYKYNEANSLPDYEGEEFYGDEANARDIYRYILDNEIPKKMTEGALMDKYKLNGDDEFKYMMLGRLQSDCKYTLGAAEGDTSHLWVKDDPEQHCALMRELINSVPEQPDWISMEDIDNYEKQMLDILAQKNKDRLIHGTNVKEYIVTVDLGDGRTIVRTTASNEEQAKKQVCDYMNLPISAAIKVKTEGTVIEESTLIEREAKTKEVIVLQGKYDLGWEDLVEYEADQYAEARRDYKDYQENEPQYQHRLIRRRVKINLNEAAMTDQEVYKVVLNWYKEQIENGKMTLNQCYELLSDKAKVSLNKLVDKSAIKEMVLTQTVSEILKECDYK